MFVQTWSSCIQMYVMYMLKGNHSRHLLSTPNVDGNMLFVKL